MTLPLGPPKTGTSPLEVSPGSAAAGTAMAICLLPLSRQVRGAWSQEPGAGPDHQGQEA